MNEKVKTKIKRKNWQFQSQRKSGNLDFANLDLFMVDISNPVTCSKLNKYIIRKTVPKIQLEILKTFVNSIKNRLIPLLLVGNQLVTDFLVKPNLFNCYFSQHFMTKDNNSTIPANMTFETEERLSNFKIC